MTVSVMFDVATHRIRIYDSYNSYESVFNLSDIEEYVRMLEEIKDGTSPLDTGNSDVQTYNAGRHYDFPHYFSGNRIIKSRVDLVLKELEDKGYISRVPEGTYDNIRNAIKEIYKIKRFVNKNVKKKLESSSLKSLLMMKYYTK